MVCISNEPGLSITDYSLCDIRLYQVFTFATLQLFFICVVWCPGLTTSLMYICPFVGKSSLNDNGFVSKQFALCYHTTYEDMNSKTLHVNVRFAMIAAHYKLDTI